jgi:hypothetical protein
MEDLKKKTVCFVDNGLFVSFARHVAPAFGRCLYHRPFQSAFVRTHDLSPGAGFPELEWCRDPLAVVDEVDLWVFPDLYQVGLQLHLRDMGCRVWGAGAGEEMELERYKFKEYLKKVGLPVQKCEQIFGFDNLRKYLKSAKGKKYVKTSFVRGDFETFGADSYESCQGRIDHIEYLVGAANKDTYEFVVEDAIPDCVEIGYDGFTIDGKFPDLAMQGYEIKDCGMVATVKPYNQLSDPVKLVNSKMVDAFKTYGYRGFFCTEIRYTKDKKPYFIDPCCRLGTPSNELLQELFGNWPEVLWYGAEGKLVPMKQKAKYGVLAMINSEWAQQNWQRVDYPKELDPHVKLRFHCRAKDGGNYIVPQQIGLSDIGCVTGTGETIAAAIKQCQERAAQIKGIQIKVNTEALDEGLEVIAAGKKFGIEF